MTGSKYNKENNNSIKNHNIENSYGNDYLKWKNWNEDSQSIILKKHERAYFLAEIYRTKFKFPKNSKVLEIGFGNGSFLKFAKDSNWDIYETEINHMLVNLADKHGFNVRHSDNLSDYDNDNFDLVVAFDVLEHVPQNDLPTFILEIRRVLKKGGFFIARFPNGDSPFGLMNQNGDVTHITTIGSGKAHYFAKKSDMEVIFIGGEAQPLFGASILHFIHRLVALPVKKILNFLITIIFFPRSNIAFCSSNLTIIYRKF